jgi:predicted HTH domain antitoxin
MPLPAMSQVTIDLPSHISSEEARLLLSIKLYEAERISLGKAAELAGYSKRAFMERLSKEGIPPINISPEDLDRELEA